MYKIVRDWANAQDMDSLDPERDSFSEGSVIFDSQYFDIKLGTLYDDLKWYFDVEFVWEGDESNSGSVAYPEKVVCKVSGHVDCYNGIREDSLKIDPDHKVDFSNYLDDERKREQFEEKIEDDSAKILAQIVNAHCIYESETWFRGHPDASWEMCPSALRGYPNLSRLAGKQKKFLESAKDFAYEISLDTMYDQLSFMQHYGIKTNLLDWSTDPLVALFFAVTDMYDQSKDGVVLILNPRTLEKKESKDLLLLDKLDDIEKGMFRLKKNIRSNRMSAQLSRFTYHTTRSINEDDYSVIRIDIPSATKKVLRDKLFKLGKNCGTIYRSLDKLAEEINRM